MQLIRDIRSGIIDEGVRISSTLRRAKILAVELSNDDFKNWVDSEVNGYRNDAILPEYRNLISPVLGNYRGYGEANAEGVQLLVSQMPEYMREKAKAIKYGNPIREIETFSEERKDTLRYPWPSEAAIILRKTMNLSGGFVLTEVYQPISMAQINGILDVVRNKLLDFVLELQVEMPEIIDDDKSIKNIPQEKIDHIFNVTINGNNNQISGGNSFSKITKNFVNNNDIESLIKLFETYGIESSDIKSLKAAIDEDNNPSEGIGPSVNNWIISIGRKIADKGLNMSIDFIIDAIKSYYDS